MNNIHPLFSCLTKKKHNKEVFGSISSNTKFPGILRLFNFDVDVEQHAKMIGITYHTKLTTFLIS